jgi:hypothetical protein
MTLDLNFLDVQSMQIAKNRHWHSVARHVPKTTQLRKCRYIKVYDKYVVTLSKFGESLYADNVIGKNQT